VASPIVDAIWSLPLSRLAFMVTAQGTGSGTLSAPVIGA
jgi:hypothetical protein